MCYDSWYEFSYSKTSEGTTFFSDNTPFKPLSLTSECLGGVPLPTKEKRPDSVHEAREKCCESKFADCPFTLAPNIIKFNSHQTINQQVWGGGGVSTSPFNNLFSSYDRITNACLEKKMQAAWYNEKNPGCKARSLWYSLDFATFYWCASHLAFLCPGFLICKWVYIMIISRKSSWSNCLYNAFKINILVSHMEKYLWSNVAIQIWVIWTLCDVMSMKIISVKVFVIASVIKTDWVYNTLLYPNPEWQCLILTRHAHSNSLCVSIIDQWILFAAGDLIISYKQRQIVLN